MNRNNHQKLPSAGPAREALRQKGQFWTPGWVAEAMVAYTLGSHADHLFDPAVGAGVFFKAAKKIQAETGRKFQLIGTEIDPSALLQAHENDLTESDLRDVEIRDFALNPPERRFDAIVANPPYIRHHRISSEAKTQLRSMATRLIGASLDGRAGLHIYFLLRALELLNPNGRLAFIMPADTCEGIFASRLWMWIAKSYHLGAVVTFTSEASPFPGVDTNPVIFMIQNNAPQKVFWWVQCNEADCDELKSWVLSGFSASCSNNALSIYQRELSEGLKTGLSRPPMNDQISPHTLSDFARVMRGIATGDNDYFFLTSAQAHKYGIPDEFLLPAIGRTRDVIGEEINGDTIKYLAAQGRPTLLFSLDGRDIAHFPDQVQRYLKHGLDIGVHKHTLIGTRNPWYKMEVRAIPPFLFAYLGRRNARFIRNRAGVLPLTGFLCIYPHQSDETFVDRLWQVLKHPDTIANLSLVGKSYGGNAIKVEPRALEQLPLPQSVLSEIGLQPVMKKLF